MPVPRQLAGAVALALLHTNVVAASDAELAETRAWPGRGASGPWATPPGWACRPLSTFRADR